MSLININGVLTTVNIQRDAAKVPTSERTKTATYVDMLQVIKVGEITDRKTCILYLAQQLSSQLFKFQRAAASKKVKSYLTKEELDRFTHVATYDNGRARIVKSCKVKSDVVPAILQAWDESSIIEDCNSDSGQFAILSAFEVKPIPTGFAEKVAKRQKAWLDLKPTFEVCTSWDYWHRIGAISQVRQMLAELQERSILAQNEKAAKRLESQADKVGEILAEMEADLTAQHEEIENYKRQVELALGRGKKAKVKPLPVELRTVERVRISGANKGQVYEVESYFTVLPEIRQHVVTYSRQMSVTRLQGLTVEFDETHTSKDKWVAMSSGALMSLADELDGRTYFESTLLPKALKGSKASKAQNATDVDKAESREYMRSAAIAQLSGNAKGAKAFRAKAKKAKAKAESASTELDFELTQEFLQVGHTLCFD